MVAKSIYLYISIKKNTTCSKIEADVVLTLRFKFFNFDLKKKNPHLFQPVHNKFPRLLSSFFMLKFKKINKYEFNQFVMTEDLIKLEATSSTRTTVCMPWFI